MKRKVIVVSSIVIGIVVFMLLVYGFIIWFAFGGGTLFLPHPSKPEIIYGEFPFQLTYELDGEIRTIKDVAICEFDGYGQRSEAGQSRKWKTHLKSEVGESISDNKRGKETDSVWITLLDLRNDGVYDDFGHEVLELYFFGGNGHYYMSDELGGHDRSPQDFTWVYYIYQNTDGIIGYSGFKADEAFEKYKIKLIGWEIASPIQNSFK